jgi:uncharacterized membrane protein
MQAQKKLLRWTSQNKNSKLGLFSFGPPKHDLFTEEEKKQIVEAIREQEKRTSGEIRVFVEKKCKYVDPVDRAREVFMGLEMEHTAHRNGVLIYVAYKDRQLAIFGDEGIYRDLGEQFWHAEVAKMIGEFTEHHFAEGIIDIIQDIGSALINHFPYDSTDKNELPDDIVFGD